MTPPPFDFERVMRPQRSAWRDCAGWLREQLGAHGEEVVPEGDDGPVVRWDRFPEKPRKGLARGLWEAMATRGVVPESWVTGGRFLFPERRVEVCHECRGADTYGRATPCGMCGGSGHLTFSEPGEGVADFDLAFTLALDPSGVSAAEELARESLRRCAPWTPRREAHSATDQHHYVWQLDGALQRPRFRTRFGAAPLGLELALGDVTVTFTRAQRPELQTPRHNEAETLLCLQRRWYELARLGAVVPERGSRGVLPRSAPIGVRFSELPCPLDPHLALMSLGYAFDGAWDGAPNLVARSARSRDTTNR